MEQKIITLVSKLAIGLVFLFLLFCVDEVLPSKMQNTVVASLLSETEPYDSRKFYYLHTRQNSEFEINKYLFESMEVGDTIHISFTPLLKKWKNFSFMHKANNKMEFLNEQFGIRTEFLIWNLAGGFLAFFAFYFKTFEKKCTAFFFAFAMAALHWWNILQ